jgi:hypothetical protein
MMVRLRFYIPEIILGISLAVAIFGMGMLASSRYQPSHTPSQQTATQHQPDGSLWGWLTHDATGFFTLALFIAVGVQAALFVWQLKLIADGTKDTKAAAEAARDAANATRDQVKLSREAFLADQRPWLALTVHIAGPLAYDDKGSQTGMCWHIPLNYQVRHRGKSPAINVDFFAKILPFTQGYWPDDQIKDGIPQGPLIPGTDLEKEFDEVCSFHEAFVDNMASGRVMIFGDMFGEAFGLNGNPALFDAAKNSQGYMGQFIVVACITYGSPLGPAHYRTAHAFALFKRTGDQRINLNGETIPLAELAFVPHPLKQSHIR